MALVRAKFYRPNEYAASGNAPVAIIADILSWTVTLTQVNRFDGHQLEMAKTRRAVLLSLAPFSTVDIEQMGVGAGGAWGVIGRGIVIAPEEQVKDTYQGTIVLDLPNITDQGLEVGTGMGYIDAQAITGIVANLGSLGSKGESVFTTPGVPYGPTGLAVTTYTPGRSTGWSAQYVDDGTVLNASAPVTWGTLVNATAVGNTVTRAATGAGGYDGSGGSGLPIHTDATRDCALQWQIVIPTVARVGLRTDGSVGAPDWGFDFAFPATATDGTKSGAFHIIAGRTILTAGAIYASNSTFSVGLAHPGGVPTMQWYVNGLLVFASGLTATAPFVPVAAISTPGGTNGGEVGNAIMSRTAKASQAWFQVQYNKQTQVGALLQLASDTGMWVRQATDAAGTPQRAYEFGPMNAPATVTLRDGRGGTLEKMRANPTMRVIKEVTAYKSDVGGVYTVATPLGANTGTAQVTIELLWRILNDLTFQDFYAKYPSLASIFPEYDSNFTIHRTPMLAGGYEYYIVYEPAFGPGGYEAWLHGAALPAGAYGAKEGGPNANSQIAYPAQATVAQQEATQRVLYKAWVELMKRAIVPHVTLTLTTIGDGRPPKAGDKVHVDYTQVGTDAKGAWTPTRILTGTDAVTNPDPRVLQVRRSASGDDVPTDAWLLSNLGKYEDTVQSQAAGQQKQIAALQVTTQTGTSASLGNPAFTEIDAAHPVVLPFYIPPTVFRVTAFYLILGFFPFRQTVTATSELIENAAGTPIISVAGVDILLATPADINALAANIGGMPLHGHNLGVLGLQAQAPTGTSHWVGVIQSGDTVLTAAGISGKTQVQTDVQVLKADDLTPSSHPHVVAKRGDIIAHIPAGTVLADVPRHFHPAPADIAEEATPSGLTVQIDSGDGVFVERTAQLLDIRSGQAGTANGFTGPAVLEISRFMDFPGRFLNVRLSSMPNATNGRGRVSWNSTILIELGGPGSIVNASQ